MLADSQVEVGKQLTADLQVPEVWFEECQAGITWNISE